MDLEQKAINRLQLASDMSLAYYQKPLVITCSGGKDSKVLLELAERSGIPFMIQHHLTTADAPETMYYIKDEFYRLECKGIKCEITKPTYKNKRVSMWSLIPMKHMPPTRVVRYCCPIFKEAYGSNRMIATGVRWSESTQRSNRAPFEVLHNDKKKKILYNDDDSQITLFDFDNTEKKQLIERCAIKARTASNPIIDWTDLDIWSYCRSEKLTMNPLYDLGFNRVGCIGCPMAGKQRNFQFKVFPKYKVNYIRAFDRMVEAREKKGLDTVWRTGDEVFAWWMDDNKQVDGQMPMEV